MVLATSLTKRAIGTKVQRSGVRHLLVALVYAGLAFGYFGTPIFFISLLAMLAMGRTLFSTFTR